ncbi:MAG TPA: YciI family protein [Thermoanaerobaculia bacterium]|nr:YciI family protein [Thermoanaerobaculia bacterium]
MNILLAVAAAALVSAAPPPSPTATPDIGPGGFEMTTYYLALLYRGPKWTPEETAETRAIQDGHMANIQRLAKEGKLLLAGPFTDGGDLRGIFVFKVGSMQEAQDLAAADPAVKAGRLRLDIHPWYSARNITVSARSPSTP